MKHLFVFFIAIIRKKQKKILVFFSHSQFTLFYFVSLFFIFKKNYSYLFSSDSDSILFFFPILTLALYVFKFLPVFLLHFIFVSLTLTIAFSYILSLFSSLFLSSIFFYFSLFCSLNHYFHIFSLISSHYSFLPKFVQFICLSLSLFLSLKLLPLYIFSLTFLFTVSFPCQFFSWVFHCFSHSTHYLFTCSLSLLFTASLSSNFSPWLFHCSSHSNHPLFIYSLFSSDCFLHL